MADSDIDISIQSAGDFPQRDECAQFCHRAIALAWRVDRNEPGLLRGVLRLADSLGGVRGRIPVFREFKKSTNRLEYSRHHWRGRAALHASAHTFRRRERRSRKAVAFPDAFARRAGRVNFDATPASAKHRSTSAAASRANFDYGRVARAFGFAALTHSRTKWGNIMLRSKPMQRPRECSAILIFMWVILFMPCILGVLSFIVPNYPASLSLFSLSIIFSFPELYLAQIISSAIYFPEYYAPIAIVLLFASSTLLTFSLARYIDISSIYRPKF